MIFVRFMFGCCFLLLCLLMFFFFKQKTAYEMRISDWSSDLCSSDLSSFRPWGLRPTRNAMALPGQKTSDWVTGMTGALHFMGAAPELIVPDNPRAVIAVPDRYEPRVGDTVLDFARHYG